MFSIEERKQIREKILAKDSGDKLISTALDLVTKGEKSQ